MTYSSNYQPSHWDESDLHVLERNRKITRVSAEFSFAEGGTINGKTRVEYVMYYDHFDAADMHKSTAHYSGYQVFVGTLGGKQGTFIVEDRGSFVGGAARSELAVVEGSGTGAFKTIKGAGSYAATSTGAELTFDVEF